MGQDVSQICNEITNEVMMVRRFIAQRSTDKMRKKLSLAYDSVITNFYKTYAPEYYRRHDVSYSGGIGWKHSRSYDGVNLFRGLDTIGTKSNHTNVYSGGIGFSPWDMKGYHYKDSKEDVLDSVLSGYRYRDVTYGDNPSMIFIAVYQDERLSIHGSPYDIFNAIYECYTNVFIQEAKNEARKELKLTYVEID